MIGIKVKKKKPRSQILAECLHKSIIYFSESASSNQPVIGQRVVSIEECEMVPAVQHCLTDILLLMKIWKVEILCQCWTSSDTQLSLSPPISPYCPEMDILDSSRCMFPITATDPRKLWTKFGSLFVTLTWRWMSPDIISSQHYGSSNYSRAL